MKNTVDYLGFFSPFVWQSHLTPMRVCRTFCSDPFFALLCFEIDTTLVISYTLIGKMEGLGLGRKGTSGLVEKWVKTQDYVFDLYSLQKWADKVLSIGMCLIPKHNSRGYGSCLLKNRLKITIQWLLNIVQCGHHRAKYGIFYTCCM